MTFISKAQKTLSAFRPLLPQLPLRTISSSLPTRAVHSQNSTGPLSISLTNRRSKTQARTTILRDYSGSSRNPENPQSGDLSKVLIAIPLVGALPKSNERTQQAILNLITEFKDDIKEQYPDITIDEIKKTLSADYFGDDLIAFAQHLIAFYESVDLSNKAFSKRDPITIADAFTDYQNARERILRDGTNYSVYIPCFNLTILPPELSYCTEASEFTLFYTRLTYLPDTIGKLQKLKKVEITGNHFLSFPECLTKLTNLTRLLYVHNHTEILPDTFCDLRSLQSLNLEKNQLSALPDRFGTLSQIETLDLQHNKLTTLPRSFGALKRLKECFLKDNQIETLPETIGNLESLTLLELEENRLSHLPDTIKNLSSLEKLYAEKNQLTEIPSNLSGLKKLEIIRLNHNNLKQLPDSLGELPHLRQLCVTHNQLTDFPASIAASKSLTGLDLGGNQLTEFNHVMPQLITLLLTKNKLTKLPPIAEMSNLKYLSIVKNPIQSLPDNLTGLDQRSHCLNDRMAIGWAGAILDVVKIPNRPTPRITVFEDTDINGHPFYFIIDENHPLFADEPVSKL